MPHVTSKIAIEEHFAITDTLGDSRTYARGGGWLNLEKQLVDVSTLRLAQMDQHGIELAVVSLNSPAIQAIPNRARAIETAQRANDALAAAIVKNPERFAGFAALPMQDPDAAARELTRAVKDLGFNGALVNGFSQIESSDRGLYYDESAYMPFWAQVEALDVPFYLHPREPLPSRAYEEHPWLMGPAWAFGAETAIHALRLMCSGLLDRHPQLRIILGHLGEGLPYGVWRLDHCLSRSPRGIPARRTMTDYLRTNFYLTTSGHFRTPSLVDAITEVGSDRIIFSVDYPFEQTEEAVGWFDTLALPSADLMKIGRANAEQLLRLPAAVRSSS